MHGNLLVVGTDDGKVQIWNLKKVILVDSFYFGKKEKGSQRKVGKKEKIRRIRFSVDERYIIVSTQNKIAYYSTVYLASDKSRSVYEEFSLAQFVKFFIFLTDLRERIIK